jgi:TolA-binding protein
MLTLAFCLNQKGDRGDAVRALEAIIEKYPGYKDAEILLREILSNEKRP